MSENSQEEKLVKLIRKVCREQIAEAFDEHLTDYKHKSRPASGEVIET